ncbi:cytochrome P450 [Apiospora rasikravindrae]|uniref:Cytochrome P450 n=1 Tax=Apiospora rasikravindrae TaxID=990691 RepID=A0ABR1TYW2_9PEZI
MSVPMSPRIAKQHCLNSTQLAFLVIILLVIYAICLSVYNGLFHPLASFPGPLSHQISVIPRLVYLVTGRLPFHVADLHVKYGSVVRISPNELAFCEPQAWKDIYGHRQQGHEEFSKYLGFYRPIKRKSPASIMSAPRHDHALLRRQLSHGFSDRSMRGQEPIIGFYVDLLIKRLRHHGGGGVKALNMREWLNWTTFDIIGDLGFGSPFGCLENSSYHPWVSAITRIVKVGSYIQALYELGGIQLVTCMVNSGIWRSRSEHKKQVHAKLIQRIQLDTERSDLIQGLLRSQDSLSFDQISAAAATLIVAGSETTATLLSGVVFLLAKNKDKLALLTKEVRSTFDKDDEITLSSVSCLSYMLACLNECLRMYPPVAIGLPRVVPKGGAAVAGEFVPEGTIVGVWQWAINHDERFWADPWEFHPERFLDNDNPRYQNDLLDAMQPFSTGPRNCIGKNLAYAEMRLILAKIVFNFDLQLADDSKEWLGRQNVYFLWEKPALHVHLTPVSQ